MRYAACANYNGSDTISFSVTDQFNNVVATGSGPATSDSKSISVTVNAVNDPLTASAPATATVTEDSSVAVSGLLISDIDSTLAPTAMYDIYTLSLHDALPISTLTNLTFTAGDGTSDAS